MGRLDTSNTNSNTNTGATSTSTGTFTGIVLVRQLVLLYIPNKYIASTNTNNNTLELKYYF